MPISPSKFAKPALGLTLIELLLVLVVLSISLQLTGASFAKRIAEARSASAMHKLSTLFSYARQEAVMRGTPITVCLIDAVGKCQRYWLEGYPVTVFIDSNKNRRYEVGETLLRQIHWPMRGAELSWRASLARTYIEFTETGGTWQNGTLYYCPDSRDARQARALVVNHAGRSYLTTDSNGDGIREDREGRNLRC